MAAGGSAFHARGPDRASNSNSSWPPLFWPNHGSKMALERKESGWQVASWRSRGWASLDGAFGSKKGASLSSRWFNGTANWSLVLDSVNRAAEY
jgi:hypothetical protein